MNYIGGDPLTDFYPGRLIREDDEHTGMTTQLEYDAVFWDIGGVILNMESVRVGHREFVFDLLAVADSPYTPEKALDIWRSELGAYFEETDGTKYRPARHGYRRAVEAVLGGDVDPDSDSTVDWEALFWQMPERHLEANPGAVETLSRLAETELHLGVISDIDHDEGKTILRNLDVFEYFDAYTTSEEVGRKKPDPEIFETALEKAGVEGDESIMIGDRYSHDMVGGDKHGMATVAYGADDGPAVDYTIENLSELLRIVGISQ